MPACACASRLRMGMVMLNPTPLSGAELLNRFVSTVPYPFDGKVPGS